MNGYTLISCIGTGMYKKEGGYRKTTYQFPGTYKSHETTLFLEAVLKTTYRPIKKVILIGTRTSCWDMLIVDPDNNEDLFFKIHSECRNSDGISDISLVELESLLSKWHNIPVKIIVHTNEINRENVESVFSAYGSIPGLLEPETDILFDISHGFRSMPLLVFQSLQLNASKLFGRRVELIYGEYIENEQISYVRDLSEYWNYYEIGSAIKLFEERLDGKLLAEKIEPFWESGAKFLIRLSEIVECNFSLQIPDALKQLKNALKDFNEAGRPQWVIDVKNIHKEIFMKLSVKDNDKYPVARTVWQYSQLLREKKLITQAVIALQVVVEASITEKMDRSKIGDYVWFNCDNPMSLGLRENANQQLKEIRRNHKKIKEPLEQLEYLRNQIAHGGGKDRNENYPHQANINGILKHIDDAIQELFTILDQDN